MVVNGLKLPPSFVRALEEELPQWVSKALLVVEGADAYGNFLEADLKEIYDKEEKIIEATAELDEYFKPTGHGDEPDGFVNEPGFIPDIFDFSKVLCFGRAYDGAPFCFDFRDNTENPTVIWWADIYWRRIAPDFQSFIDLFRVGNSD